jgi:hypothetical protein
MAANPNPNPRPYWVQYRTNDGRVRVSRYATLVERDRFYSNYTRLGGRVLQLGLGPAPEVQA